MGTAQQGRTTMATFVLVHGAWHGGWCWRKLTPLLRAAGHEVFAPTLTGLGERAHLASPDVGLETHVQDVVSMLEYEDLSGVVLVGHSYGGLVITGAAHQAPGRLAHLVYLDAFIPEDGQSMLDLGPPERRETMGKRVREEGDGWRLPSLQPMPWEQFVREVYLVTDEAEVAWLAARLGPHPFKTMTDPVRATNPAAASLPRTYIRCLRYPNPAFDRHAEEVQRPGSNWRFHALPTSHDAMVTMPRELADLLLAIS
jgi:pimeloyl-ACP methyl ester carboxylesterase